MCCQTIVKNSTSSLMYESESYTVQKETLQPNLPMLTKLPNLPFTCIYPCVF